MKTLVIHPKDKTTDFLSVIYQDKDWTVITDPYLSKSKLRKAIKEHDRIVMLGHGTPKGLVIIEKNMFKYIIDSTFVYLLREKDCVCVWCEADQFVEKYNLKGFYTGMIISDIEEAYMWNIKASLDDIDNSNELFAQSIKNSIDSRSMLLDMKFSYIGESNVINFNKQNLFLK